ncbi:MAG: hypothetical protein MUF30_00245 [Burkholderiales bacterium]|jgi:hypothetical protein|nr:hypothetical protein [Burkholderiales bacterium]
MSEIAPVSLAVRPVSPMSRPGRPVRPSPTVHRPRPRPIGTGRDLDFLRAAPTPLKVWLPESAETLLDRWAAAHGMTKAGVVAQILITHLYGWCDLEAHFGDATFWNTATSRAAASRSPAYRTELGKSIADVRLQIPPQARQDLAALADACGLKISAYARRVIVDHFFGRMPTPIEIGEPPADAD